MLFFYIVQFFYSKYATFRFQTLIVYIMKSYARHFLGSDGHNFY